MSELDKKMKPVEIEARWQAFWESEGVYEFNATQVTEQPIYSIDTPPPTISGHIHMGHVFSYVQAEIIARFWRMKGYNVFYPFGFDDNGLPTERLVERERDVRATQMDRGEFVDMCLETTKRYEEEFKTFWTRLGFSVDWDLEYSTIDKRCQRISQRSFIRLFDQGEVYRQEAPTLWCVECQTAIAQAETESRDLPSEFHDVAFALPDGQTATIATTRPELLPACVAIFYHPSDERYTALQGQTALTPLFGQEVKILADERADPEKGTGLVMCCTFGDTTDVDWWRDHGLPLRLAMGVDGRMNELAGEFAGQPVPGARKNIVKALREQGIITDSCKIEHPVSCHERCHTPLEFQVNKQWFIRVLDKKDELIEKGIVISGDRGLAGPYNSTVIRAAEREVMDNQVHGIDYSLVLIGKKARDYFKFRNYRIDAFYEGITDTPDYESAREVADYVADQFTSGAIDQVLLIYTEFVSIGTQRLAVRQFLPLLSVAEIAAAGTGEEINSEFEFEPSPDEVLASLLPRYIENRLFSALLDASASEHANRQRAMKAATDNAEELITKLGRRLSSARQAAITTEIMEIVGGAEALGGGIEDVGPSLAKILQSITPNQ